MKIPLDLKFLATATITFFIILLVVHILNKLAGTPVATVAGGILGMIAIRFFDKLDYSPTSKLEIQSESLHPVISGIFILYGCTIFVKIWKGVFMMIYGDDYLCNLFFIPIGLIFDFGGFIVGGWLIGRIFPRNSMRVTAVAGFFLVIVLTVSAAAGEYTINFERVINCLIRQGIMSEKSTGEGWEYLMYGSKFGVLLGGITRAYIAIVMARISSRKYWDKQIKIA